MRVLTAVLLCSLCAVSQAADRTEKIRELMELQGLGKMFDQQLQQGREQTRNTAHRILDKLLDGLNPPAPFQAKFRDAADEFIQSAQSPWTGEEIVEVWSKYYGAKFTDSELDQLLDHYRSPLGQKDIAATREAIGPYTAEFQEKYKPVIDKATQQFVAHLQAIVAECNCKK